MASNERISDLPDATETLAAEAAVAQQGQTRKYTLGTAARKNTGSNAGDVPVLDTGGVLSLARGGTGRDNSTAGNNKVFGTDATGAPAVHDLPGGTPSIPDGSITNAKLASEAVSTAKIAPQAVSTGQVKDLSITAGKLGSGAVIASKIAAGAVGTDAVAAHSITTGKLANSAVNNAALADSSVRFENLDAGNGTDGQVLSVGTSGGVRVLEFTNKGDTTIADGSITTQKLADDAVERAKIANDAVGEDQIADDSVGAAQLKTTNAGTSGQALTKNADGGLTYATITGSGGNEVADGSITTAKLADNAVNAAKLANGAVDTAAVVDAAISLAKLNVSGTAVAGKVMKVNSSANGLVFADDANNVADGGITTAKLADGAVTTDKLGSDAVDNSKIKDNAVDIENVNATGRAAGKYLAANADNDGFAYVNAPDSTPANNSITTAMLQDDVITSAKIDNAAVVEAALAGGAVSADKIKASAVGLDKLNATGKGANKHIAISADGNSLVAVDPPSGGGGGGGLTIGGTRALGKIMVAQSSTTQSWDDPADPSTSIPGWGSANEPALISTLASNNTYIANNLNGITAIVTNNFNASTQTLNDGASTENWLFSPNFGSIGSAQVLPSGSVTFYAGLFAKSGGGHYVYLSRGNAGWGAFQRTGSTWTQLQTGNAAIQSPDSLPDDDHWYVVSDLPTGRPVGLGKRNGSQTVVAGIRFSADFSNYGLWYNIRESQPIRFAIADGQVEEAKLASAAVSGNKIKDGAIDSSAKFAAGVVNGNALAANSVDLSKLNAANKAANRYLTINSNNNGLTAVDAPSTTPANNSITRAMLQNDIIDQSKISDSAVQLEHLNAGSGSAFQILVRNLNNNGLDWANNVPDSGSVGYNQINASNKAANRYLKINSSNNALEFDTVSATPGTNSITRAMLQDNIVGYAELRANNKAANRYLRINSTNNGLEFATVSGGGSSTRTVESIYSSSSGRKNGANISLSSGKSFADYDEICLVVGHTYNSNTTRYVSPWYERSLIQQSSTRLQFNYSDVTVSPQESNPGGSHRIRIINNTTFDLIFVPTVLTQQDGYNLYNIYGKKVS